MASKVNSKIKINKAGINELNTIAKKTLHQTSEAFLTQMKKDAYMPFDTGNMQNDSTFVDDNELDDGVCAIVSSTPYARRIYYNADGWTIHQEKNPNARDHWFEPYIAGDEKDFIPNTFEKLMRKNLKGGK